MFQAVLWRGTTQITTEELNAFPHFSRKGTLGNVEHTLRLDFSLFQNPELDSAEGIAGQPGGVLSRRIPDTWQHSLTEGIVHLRE